REGKKEARAGWNPARVVERESAGRDDTVNMGMKLKLLVPGMQHTEEADLGSQTSGIAGDFQKSFCAGTEQQVIDHFFVLQGQGRQLRMQSENDMDVGRGEKFAATCLKPAFAGARLTLRAMASSTLMCGQRIHWRLRSMKAVPAVRTRSATSRSGRLIYSSCWDLPFSTSESRGLAVAWR